jgi:hypothetical protein
MLRILSRIFLVLVLVAIALGAYAFWPRKADLRDFDADAVGRLETGMWRDYYSHDYKTLATRLYALYHDVYRFSPADSARLAVYSGKAAELFQPTTNRAEARVALPMLVSYYTLLRDHGGESFDPAHAAEIELDWWQLRREKATPEHYGNVIAEVDEEIFKVHNEHVTKSAQIRAAMMRYRDDRRDGAMQPEDWQHIEENLIESYRELKAGVARGS